MPPQDNQDPTANMGGVQPTDGTQQPAAPQATPDVPVDPTQTTMPPAPDEGGVPATPAAPAQGMPQADMPAPEAPVEPTLGATPAPGTDVAPEQPAGNPDDNQQPPAGPAFPQQ